MPTENDYSICGKVFPHEERMVFKRKPSFMFMLYLFILYLILISSSFPSATDTTASFPGRTSLLIPY